MGGRGIFKVSANDPNRNTIVETCTQYGSKHMMAQKFITEITQGDKRILLIDGVPCENMLVRIPGDNDFRGNMAAGGNSTIQPLDQHDRDVCAQIGPTLAKKGLTFVGIDLIGPYLTEINVTSPTGIKQLEACSNASICEQLCATIANKLAKSSPAMT